MPHECIYACDNHGSTNDRCGQVGTLFNCERCDITSERKQKCTNSPKNLIDKRQRLRSAMELVPLLRFSFELSEQTFGTVWNNFVDLFKNRRRRDRSLPTDFHDLEVAVAS